MMILLHYLFICILIPVLVQSYGKIFDAEIYPPGYKSPNSKTEQIITKMTKILECQEWI